MGRGDSCDPPAPRRSDECALPETGRGDSILGVSSRRDMRLLPETWQSDACALPGRGESYALLALGRGDDCDIPLAGPGDECALRHRPGDNGVIPQSGLGGDECAFRGERCARRGDECTLPEAERGVCVLPVLGRGEPGTCRQPPLRTAAFWHLPRLLTSGHTNKLGNCCGVICSGSLLGVAADGVHAPTGRAPVMGDMVTWQTPSGMGCTRADARFQRNICFSRS